MRILCLNAGSSSLKYSIDGETGAFEEVEDHARAAEELLDRVPKPDAVGHRVVHGGTNIAPCLVDEGELEKLIPLAPLHLPPALAVIRAVRHRYPDLPQVSCFDTMFHRTMPEVAERFALPEWCWEAGVRRYGFHGLSYQYIASKIGPGRTVVAHLGNGASLCAMRDGVSVDTSMGLTPTGGIPMGSRSGDLDPGVLLFLLRQGKSVDELEVLLDRESGLRGVSGITHDMHQLLESSEPSAKKAVEMFCYNVRKWIGAYAAVLGGLDRLVFAGGIGERAAFVRERICVGLDYLQPFEIEVIATDEDAVIRELTEEVLSA
jgi:acetate kinase